MSLNFANLLTRDENRKRSGMSPEVCNLITRMQWKTNRNGNENRF